MHPSLVVARKELLQLSRDRIGLFAGIVLPALLMALLAGIVFGFALKKPAIDASKIVRMGASREDYDAYVNLAWEWFQRHSPSISSKEDLAKLGERLQFGPSHVDVDIPLNGLTSAQHFEKWCKAVAYSYRINIRDVSYSNVILRGSDKEFEDLVIVVVKGIGNVEFVAIDLPQETLDVSRKVKGAIDSSTFDVFLETRRIPKVQTEGMIKYQLGFRTFADRGNTQSVNAESQVKQLLTICSNDVERTRVFDTILDDGIDVAVVGSLPAKIKVLLWFLSVYVSLVVYALVLRSACEFASEFGTTERALKTLEPLFLTHASRTAIALGKYIAVCVSVAAAGFMMIGCFWVTLRFMIPYELFPRQTLWETIRALVLLNLILLPIVLSASGVALAVSFMSSSPIRAGAYGYVAMWAMIAPGFYLFASGDQPSVIASFVPMLGTSLLLKGLIQSTFEWKCFAISMISSLTLAGVSVAIIVVLSNRESVLYSE